MPNIQTDIALSIKNNLNRQAQLSIFGGNQPNDQANAHYLYDYDLSAESFINTYVVQIQSRLTTEASFRTYTIYNPDGLISDIQTVADLLNTLNQGIFNVDGDVVWTLNDNIIFGDLTLDISANFNINTFVQDAYNYFDPLDITGLASFSANYTSIINWCFFNVQGFYSNIITLGWGCTYVFTQTTNTSSYADKTIGEPLFCIGYNGISTYTLQDYTNNASGNFLNDSYNLIYSGNKYFYNLGTSFTITLNGNVTAYYTGGLLNLFLNATSVINTALNPSYFAQNGKLISTAFPTANALNIPASYGNNFPAIAQTINTGGTIYTPYNLYMNACKLSQSTYTLTFGNYGLGDITIGMVNTLVSAGITMSSNFSSLTGAFLISGGTFTLSFQDVSATPTLYDFNLTIDSSFNTKFGSRGQILDSLIPAFAIDGNISDPSNLTIAFADTTTPIDIQYTYIVFYGLTMPILPVFGNVMKYDLATNTNLMNFSFTYVGVTSGFEATYFNQLVSNLGNVSKYGNGGKLSVIGATSGTIDISNNGTFNLSGFGIAGFAKIINQGLTYVSDATPSNYLTIGTNGTAFNTILTTQTFPLFSPPSTFNVQIAEENVGDSTQNSVNVGVSSEQVVINSSANIQNILFSIPSNACVLTISASGSTNKNNFGCFLMGGGNFSANVDGLSINNLSISDADDFDISGYIGSASSVSFNYCEETIQNGLHFNFSIGVNSFTLNNSSMLTSTTNSNFLTLLGFGSFSYGVTIQNTTFNYANDNTNPIRFYGNSGSGAYITSLYINNVSFCPTIGDAINIEFVPNATTFIPTSIFINNTNDIRKIDFANSVLQYPSSLTTLTATSCSNLTTLLASYQSLNSVSINGNTNLVILDLSHNAILSVTLTGLTNLLNIDVSYNWINSGNLDNLINQVNAYGTSNGTLNYSNQLGNPSPSIAGSGVSYNALISRGWTIIGNVPI